MTTLAGDGEAVEASEQGEELVLGKRERDKLGRMLDAIPRMEQQLQQLSLQGLQRVSKSSLVEIQALSQIMHNAALVTLERQLETLHTQLSRYLNKDPLFRVVDYLSTLNRVWLLSRKLKQKLAEGKAPAELVEFAGEMRRKYLEYPAPIYLQPLGATGWVSDTDFVGITVYFYAQEESGKTTIYQASNSRPCLYFGKNPSELMDISVNDTLHVSMSALMHNAYLMTNAKISSDGRISFHKELGLQKAPYRGASAYQSISIANWIQLVDKMRENNLHPVRGAEASLVFIEPRGSKTLHVDEKRNRVTVDLLDERGAALQLEVPMRAENNLLLDNLERMFAAKSEVTPIAYFGRASISDGKLKFFPYTAIFDQLLQKKSDKRAGPREARSGYNEVHLSLESLRNMTSR